MIPLSLPRATGLPPCAFTLLLLALTVLASAHIAGTIGQWVSYSRGGSAWTSDAGRISVFIGDRPFAIPANMIRHANQRAENRRLERISIAVVWPEMLGYDESRSSAFADTGDRSPMILISIENDRTTIGTRERLEKVYRRLTDARPLPGPEGLSLLPLAGSQAGGSDYVAFDPGDQTGFAARCFSPTDPALAAMCQRDIRLEGDLLLTYRFRQTHLADWQALDRKIRRLVAGFSRRG